MINNVKSRTVLVGSFIFSIWHVIDVALDLLYIKETPMETDYYYVLIVIFMILPVLFVMVIAFIETREYKKGPLGFIMFTLGGLTSSTGMILKNFYHIDDQDNKN